MSYNRKNQKQDNKLEFIEQLALLTITNYKLQITNGYITEGVF